MKWSIKQIIKSECFEKWLAKLEEVNSYSKIDNIFCIS